MREVLEVILKVILLLGLFYIAWFDYKTKLIEMKWLLIFGMVGMIGIVVQRDWALISQSCLGTLVGVSLLVFSWFSRESIGFGDGWLFVITGVFLGIWENFVLLFGSLILVGIFAVTCLVLKKIERNDRVALAPFVLTAYVVFVL